MQTGSFRDDWLFPFIIITVIYLISFGLTIYWLLPVQEMFAPEMAAFASLLFLQHGVRVLSAWLLGWKSIVLIAPVALLRIGSYLMRRAFLPQAFLAQCQASYVLQRAFGSSRKRGSTFKFPIASRPIGGTLWWLAVWPR